MTNPSTPLACIILAAGQGTRMRSNLPKVLHKIAGFPMVTHVRHTCEALSPQKIVAVVGPDAKDVAAAFEPHAAVVQKERLGTAHAVLAAREALAGFKGRVLVVYGDTPLLTQATLQALINVQTPICLLAFEPQDPAHYGRLVLKSRESVGAIVEYADANEQQRQIKLCNAGVMAFDAQQMWDVLAAIKPHNAKKEYYLTDAVAIAAAKGLACSYVRADESEVIGINSRVDLAAAEKIMQQRLRARAMENGATLIDPDTVYLCADTRLGADTTIGPHVVFGPAVEVEAGAEILPFSHLEGCQVKAGARIGPYARLRPGALIEEKAHIGNFVEIKKAQVGAGAKINHLSYIGDARVGARTNVGAGTITCNFDGYHKHRTDIGEDVFVGSNSALVAPVTIGDRAIIAAGSTVTDNIPADAMAVARGKQETKPGWAARYKEKKR